MAARIARAAAPIPGAVGPPNPIIADPSTGPTTMLELVMAESHPRVLVRASGGLKSVA